MKVRVGVENTFQREKGIIYGLSSALRWLVGLEWLAVAAAAPLLIFPTLRPVWTAAALVVLMTLWLLRWIVRREPWPVTPLNGALLLLALMIPVAVWVCALPELALPEASRLVLGLAALRATTLAVQDRRSLNLALAVFCLLGLAIIALGMVAAQWTDKVPVLWALAGRIPRLFATLPVDQGTPGINPNHLAGGLMLFLPLAVALVAAWRFRRRAVLRTLLVLAGCVVFLALVAGVLVLTQSRSGWIGGVGGLLGLWTLWGLTGRRLWARVLGVALPLLVLVAVIAGFLYIGPQRVGEVVYGAGSDAPVDAVFGTMSIAGRVEIWRRALFAIQDFPFTGLGLGMFSHVMRVLYPLFSVAPDVEIGHAHDIFLQTALDLGLPGLVAYLALLAVAGMSCYHSARRGDPLVRPVALGLAAGLVGLHVYGLADALVLSSKPALALWMALGLTAALPRVSGRTRSEVEGDESADAPRPLSAARRLTTRPWLIAAVVLFDILLLLGVIYLSWRVLRVF